MLTCRMVFVQDIAQEVGIRAMPTFMVFKNGEKVRSSLALPPAHVKRLIGLCCEQIDDFSGADPAKLKVSGTLLF